MAGCVFIAIDSADERGPWWETLFERDYYDFFAEGGPRSTITPEETDAATAAQVDFIVERLAPEPGAAILDLCCGFGRHAVRLAGRGYRVTGLDISAYHIELAQRAAAAAGVAESKIPTGSCRVRR